MSLNLIDIWDYWQREMEQMHICSLDMEQTRMISRKEILELLTNFSIINE